MSGSIQPVSSYLQSFKAGFEEKYTRFANWTSVKLGSVQKTTKAFFEVLVNVLLWPLRGLANAGRATRDLFFGSMAASNAKKPETTQAEELQMKREADVPHV